jgi:hypothetical protein
MARKEAGRSGAIRRASESPGAADLNAAKIAFSLPFPAGSCCLPSMKGMLGIRVTVLVLMASQLSSCAWLAAWQSKWKNEPEATPPQTPEPKPEPKPQPRVPDNLPKPPPDPEPQPDPQPEPEPEPEPQPGPKPRPQNVPVARAVPGKPGFVFSPFNNKLIDVQGIQSGRMVADPHYPAADKKYFRVP